MSDPIFIRTEGELVDFCKKNRLLLYGSTYSTHAGNKDIGTTYYRVANLYTETAELDSEQEKVYGDASPWLWLYRAVAAATEQAVGTAISPVEDFNSLNGQRMDIAIPRSVAMKIHDELLNPNSDSDFRKIVSHSTKRSFIYIDISDFSKLPAAQQVLVINAVSSVIDKACFAVLIESRLCIGDGYILVMKSPLEATLVAADIANFLQTGVADGRVRGLPVDFHFRMSVHFGSIFRFWEESPGVARWNYIGDGINGGQRVLAAIGKDLDDVVFISDEVVQFILAMRDEDVSITADVIGCLENKGRREDKHKKFWRVYQLNHSRLAHLMHTGGRVANFVERRRGEILASKK